MAAGTPGNPQSPWRRIFEDVRRSVGNTRDSNGVQGSINWLRKQMELHGANPNVVRNIIYRDKGKLKDKRVLFDILNRLWVDRGNPPLQAPELEVLLSPGSSAEQEILQLLGREKRRAYRTFVSGVRGNDHPKLLVTGRPGSGKTLLTDYIQQALELEPRIPQRIVRLEFSGLDLADSLTRLGSALEVAPELMEAKLVRIATSSAFAVQADAQADVARSILDALRNSREPLVLLLHVSQSIRGLDSLGMAPLRLNTPDVPRVSATEWLWETLFEPISKLADVSILVSMSDVPARTLQRLGNFDGPIRLSPPTTSEARRFVKARLPHLSSSQQESVVQRAGRSFEELRTLTLLAEIREPGAEQSDDQGATARHIEQLSQLVQTSGDARLRDFLGALAVLSLPEFPTFHSEVLAALRQDSWMHPNNLEQAFVDTVPGRDGYQRCFSRQLARSLRAHLSEFDPGLYHGLNRRAAEFYRQVAVADSKGEEAARYLHHLFEARDWDALDAWLSRFSIQQSLVRRVWQAAQEELGSGPTFERIAFQVASHYVKLGSYEHPDAHGSFDALAASERTDMRAWTRLKRAEGAVLRGSFDQAESLVQDWPHTDDPLLDAEAALVQASIARWRSQLETAAKRVDDKARPLLERIDSHGAAGRLVHAKVAVWAGLIAKDRGDLEGALSEFQSLNSEDDLIEARLAFQTGDVLMKLGRFDQALKELNLAVKLSHRSEALVQEQTRYLARRGTLYRRRGDLLSAEHDFDAARAILLGNGGSEPELESAFWLAKVDDERGLNLLAHGRHQEAAFLFKRNLDVFHRYGAAFGVNADYRVLRTTLHLAIAYACRGLALPYRIPEAAAAVEATHSADLEHAQRLFRQVLDTIDGRPDRRHYEHLMRSSLLAASLFARQAVEAEDHARRAFEGARYPYLAAESLAHLATAQLRQGDAAATLSSAGDAAQALGKAQHSADPQEQGDRGLEAWLYSLRLTAHLLEGDGPTAAAHLSEALKRPDLASHHETLLRVFGEAVERHAVRGWSEHRGLRRLLKLGTSLPSLNVLRLPDALVASWQNRTHDSRVGR